MYGSVVYFTTRVCTVTRRQNYVCIIQIQKQKVKKYEQNYLLVNYRDKIDQRKNTIYEV